MPEPTPESTVKITPTKTGGTTQTTTVEIQNFTYVPILDLGKLTKSSTLSLGVIVGAKRTMLQITQ